MLAPVVRVLTDAGPQFFFFNFRQAEFYAERLQNLITHNALLTANAYWMELRGKNSLFYGARLDRHVPCSLASHLACSYTDRVGEENGCKLCARLQQYMVWMQFPGCRVKGASRRRGQLPQRGYGRF